MDIRECFLSSADLGGDIPAGELKFIDLAKGTGSLRFQVRNPANPSFKAPT